MVLDNEDDAVKRYIGNYTNYSRPRKINQHRDHLISSIQSATNLAACIPYSPSQWLIRGKLLMKLQYPELAVGDAHKALMLIKYFRLAQPSIGPKVLYELARDVKLNWMLNYMSPRLDMLSSYGKEILRHSNELERTVSILLAQALLCTHSFVDALSALTYISGRHREENVLTNLRAAIEMARAEQDLLLRAEGLTSIEVAQEEKHGRINLRRYPFMSTILTTRSSQTIREANTSIYKTSGQTCHVTNSDIRKDENGKEVFGMFATVRIAAEAHSLSDITIWCAVEDPTKACATCCKIMPIASIRKTCCGLKICSEICWKRADAYHKIQCRRDLKPYSTAKPSPLLSSEMVADDRLLLRVLTTLVYGDAPHPLRGLYVNALTASYDGEAPVRFSLAIDVVRSFDMLTRLGVDIFADQKWDTWVILTIMARLRNNSRESNAGGRHLVAINPLFSFFNHSCDPNVTDLNCEDNLNLSFDAGKMMLSDKEDTSSTLTMKTTRPVDAGEELFISYLSEEELAWPRDERNEKLKQWIGRDCRCKRCIREMDEEAEFPRTRYLNKVFGRQRYRLLHKDTMGDKIQRIARGGRKAVLTS